MGAPSERIDDLTAQLKRMQREIDELKSGVFGRGKTNAQQRAYINELVSVGALIAPSPSNGFNLAPSGHTPVSYYIDGFGRVYFNGTAGVPAGIAGLTYPVRIFQLQDGYRPDFRKRFVSAGEYADSISEVIIDVKADGWVELSMGGFAAQPISFDLIHYLVDPPGPLESD